MTIRDASEFGVGGDTSELVRSVALSSARLWEEVLERLVRVERSQLQLARTVADMQTALPAGSGQFELPTAAESSVRVLARPIELTGEPVIEVLSSGDFVPPPPPVGYAIVPDSAPTTELRPAAPGQGAPGAVPNLTWTDRVTVPAPSARIAQADPLSQLLFQPADAGQADAHRASAAVRPLGFAAEDLSGSDAIGAKVVEVAAEPAEEPRCSRRADSPVTPDFFARAYRSKR